MTKISWNESIPSDTSNVGNLPPYLRSVWTAVTTGMATEMLWAGSGGASDASAGDWRPGGSRAFYAAQSASSAPNSQMTGRLFLTSDTSRLLVYDSTGTYLVGSAGFVQHAGDCGTGMWLTQSGSTTTTIGATAVFLPFVNFPVSYLSVPRIFQSSSATGYLLSVKTSATTGFTSWLSYVNGPTSAITIYWDSHGTVSGANY